MLESRLVASILDAIFHAIPQLIFKTISTLLIAIKEALLMIGGTKADAVFARLAKWYLSKTTKVEDDLVVFITAQKEFTCNPKYIAEELIRRRVNWKMVWAVDENTRGPFPQALEFVTSQSADYYRLLAKAKVVVFNNHALQLQRVFKNNGRQFWIQTWHGSLGLKKLEGSGGRPKMYKKLRELDIKQTDYLISNSQFEDEVYSSTYWPGIESRKLGHARNDLLFDNSAETANRLRAKVLTRLGVEDTGQKFVMFAPTHDDTNPNQSFAHIDFDALTQKLAYKFGGNWEVLIRTHNSTRNRSAAWLSGLPTYCHNASSYPDMQELMMVADVGLTDYSSWICDYLITRKPGFLIGANIEEYKQSRGFYHDFADTPFDLATSNEELMRNIETFDPTLFEQKIDSFFAMCGLMDDGMASKRIADFIEELVAKPLPVSAKA